MTAVVTFFLIILLPGKAPLAFDKEMALEQCLYEVHEITTKPPHELLVKGGRIETGCMREFKPSVEH